MAGTAISNGGSGCIEALPLFEPMIPINKKRMQMELTHASFRLPSRSVARNETCANSDFNA